MFKNKTNFAQVPVNIIQWEVYYTLLIPCFRERKLWGEICFLLLCWSHCLLFFTNGSCNRCAGNPTHDAPCIICKLPSSATCFPYMQSSPYMLFCHHSVILLLPFLLLFDICQRLLRLTKSKRQKKWHMQKGNPVGLLPQARGFVCLKWVHDCYKNSIFIFYKLSCENM